MIIGGIGGVFKTGPGGSRTGYYETFLPMAIDTISQASINNIIDSARPLSLSANAEILDDDGEWVPMPDITYFQTTEKSDGSGSAMITLANAEKWSVSGTQNNGLLTPSNRQIRIVATLKSGLFSYSVLQFSGIIETYSESHGQRNATISLTARPFSATASNRIIKGLSRSTTYRKMLDEAAQCGIFAVGQCVVFFGPDYAGADALFLTPTIDLASMIYQLVAYPIQQTRGNGGLLVTYKTTVISQTVTSEFAVDDSAIISMTKAVGGATAYNTMIVQGTFNSVILTSTVSDAADIANRGVFADPVVYGDAEVSLSTNIASATALMAENLRDRLSIQIRFNPLLKANTVLRINSDRLFAVDVQGRIGTVTSTYQHGNAMTTLSDVAVLA